MFCGIFSSLNGPLSLDCFIFSVFHLKWNTYESNELVFSNSDCFNAASCRFILYLCVLGHWFVSSCMCVCVYVCVCVYTWADIFVHKIWVERILEILNTIYSCFYSYYIVLSYSLVLTWPNILYGMMKPL
jgi:hypothetical protein